MTNPINNANFSTHTAPQASKPDPDRAAAHTDDDTPSTTSPSTPLASEDRASLSGPVAAPVAASERLQTTAAAREAVAQLGQLIQADPASALVAQQGINGHAAAGALARPAA